MTRGGCGLNDRRVLVMIVALSRVRNISPMRPGGAAGQTCALAPIVRSEQTNGNNGVLSHILHPPGRHRGTPMCWPPVCMFRYATPFPRSHPRPCPLAAPSSFHGGDLLCASRLESLLPHTPRDSGYVAPSPRDSLAQPFSFALPGSSVPVSSVIRSDGG